MDKFKTLNAEGTEVEYSIILTFDSDVTNKSYMVCTDGSKDDQGNIEQYVFSYDTSKSEYELSPITDDEEWKMVNEVCRELLNEK